MRKYTANSFSIAEGEGRLRDEVRDKTGEVLQFRLVQIGVISSFVVFINIIVIKECYI